MDVSILAGGDVSSIPLQQKADTSTQKGTQIASGDAQPHAEKIEEAARQFEALLITQLLRAAKSTETGGWLGSGEDSSASSAIESAEEQFAAVLSSQGGMGLAKLIVEGLQRRTEVMKSPDQIQEVRSDSPSSS